MEFKFESAYPRKESKQISQAVLVGLKTGGSNVLFLYCEPKKQTIENP